MLFSSHVLPYTGTNAHLFFLTPHFWEGTIAAAAAGGFFAQWVWPVLHKGWIRRRNYMVLIEGREEIPGVAPAVPALPDRLGTMESLLSSVADKVDLALKISANTNLKVTANGGNTDSAPDVLQRMAKKMGVWDHDGAPPISVANVIDLGDVLASVHSDAHTSEASIAPHHHDGLQGGEVSDQPV